MQERVGQHAVVMGAGMGGLAAAKAVCACFEQVTLVERDTLPAEPAHRSGTPQARHTHVLLGGGLAALASMCPTIEQDLGLKPQNALRAPDLLQRVTALMKQAPEAESAGNGGQSP